MSIFSIYRHLNEAQSEAIATADAYTNNAVLPNYTELYALAHRLAYPEAGEALLLENYQTIARNILNSKSAVRPGRSIDRPAYGQLAKQYCGKELALQVLRSAVGYYIGTADEDGPVSRESWEYFQSRQDAQEALATGDWTQKPKP